MDVTTDITTIDKVTHCDTPARFTGRTGRFVNYRCGSCGTTWAVEHAAIMADLDAMIETLIEVAS